MARASVDPANYFGDEEFERESAEMVREWMEQASHGKMVLFLAEAGPERFFDEEGDPDEVWLDEDGNFEAGEVFTALWEGRSMSDAGNYDAFRTALGKAEDHFDETILERLGRQ